MASLVIGLRSLALIPLGLLGGCVGQPPAAPTSDDGTATWGTVTTATSTSDVGPSTTPSMTDSASVDSSTTGFTSVDPPNPSSSSDSSGDSSSGGTGIEPECRFDRDCGPDAVCDDGQCAPQCSEGRGSGTYDGCLNTYGGFDLTGQCGARLPEALCATYGDPITATSCSFQECDSACDCPAPPPTGNATVTCGDLIPGGASDCYLSCADGETCPDGMVCQDEQHCVTGVSPLPMYGNCGSIAAECTGKSQCYTYYGGTHALCVAACDSDFECDPSPPGATFEAQCSAVPLPPSGPQCIIPCNVGNDCPSGMECVDDDFCAWPL